jgi:2,5-dihydroxypyridine 5,6-dioxygenase
MRRVPTNPAVGAELVELFTKELELCRVTPNETVLGFTNTLSNPSYAAALFGACGVIGADYFQITVPSGDAWHQSRAVVDAWKSADLVVGLHDGSGAGWLYSDAHNEALDAGTRTLMIEQPEDILRRLFPTEQLHARAVAGGRLLEPATTIRITSEAGTDLTMSKEGRPASIQYGVADVAGHWDHWPSGQVAIAPVEDRTEGVLVIDVGDVLMDLGRYVQAPVRVTFHEGVATKIDGGVDARLMRDYLEAANDIRAFQLSHVGWGTEDRAKWETISTRYWENGGVLDTESFYGDTLIAFGRNFFRGLSGENRVPLHLDIPMRNHSFWVDDTQVIDRGRFLLPELG